MRSLLLREEVSRADKGKNQTETVKKLVKLSFQKKIDFIYINLPFSFQFYKVNMSISTICVLVQIKLFT